MYRSKVILVDKNDKPIGVAGKLEAHEIGLLHRAFSVFVFKKINEDIFIIDYKTSNNILDVKQLLNPLQMIIYYLYI